MKFSYVWEFAFVIFCGIGAVSITPVVAHTEENTDLPIDNSIPEISPSDSAKSANSRYERTGNGNPSPLSDKVEEISEVSSDSNDIRNEIPVDSANSVSSEGLTTGNTDIDPSARGDWAGEGSSLSFEKRTDGDHSKSGTKLFSLTSVIKNLFSPVVEEFQEGVSLEKEQQPLFNTSNITTADYNVTVVDDDLQRDKNGTDSRKKVKFTCTGRNVTENTTTLVEIVNGTVLLDILSFSKNRTGSDCVLVMFYAPWCQFCAQTAPHFNALGRAFPQLEVLAVDAVYFSNLNARFGTVAVPNVMLFHQSRSAVRFNHTERTFEMFVQFVRNVSGLEPNSTINVTDEDYLGPLPSVPMEDTDYFLILAWIFVVSCSCWIFINSNTGQHAINKVRLLWQEHQHIE